MAWKNEGEGMGRRITHRGAKRTIARGSFMIAAFGDVRRVVLEVAKIRAGYVIFHNGRMLGIGPYEKERALMLANLREGEGLGPDLVIAQRFKTRPLGGRVVAIEWLRVVHRGGQYLITQGDQVVAVEPCCYAALEYAGLKRGEGLLGTGAALPAANEPGRRRHAQ